MITAVPNNLHSQAALRKCVPSWCKKTIKSALKDSLGLQASLNEETTTSYAGLFHACAIIPFPLHISKKDAARPYGPCLEHI